MGWPVSVSGLVIINMGFRVGVVSQGKVTFLTSGAKMTHVNEFCTLKYAKIDPHDIGGKICSTVRTGPFGNGPSGPKWSKVNFYGN